MKSSCHSAPPSTSAHRHLQGVWNSPVSDYALIILIIFIFCWLHLSSFSIHFVHSRSSTLWSTLLLPHLVFTSIFLFLSYADCSVSLYVLLSKIYLWHSCMFMCCINSYVYPYHTFYVRLYKLCMSVPFLVFMRIMCAQLAVMYAGVHLLCILTSACTYLRIPVLVQGCLSG
jgi:hypothetical protein